MIESIGSCTWAGLLLLVAAVAVGATLLLDKGAKGFGVRLDVQIGCMVSIVLLALVAKPAAMCVGLIP